MAKKKSNFAWGQPVCPECWENMSVKIGRPMKNAEEQSCCYCRATIGVGEAHVQRVNPNAVPYPTIEKEV